MICGCTISMLFSALLSGCEAPRLLRLDNGGGVSARTAQESLLLVVGTVWQCVSVYTVLF